MVSERPTILVAHPSADLYGSDRMLLESVAGLVDEGWRVVVTVPSFGPLVDELIACGAEVHPCRVAVVRKSVLRPAGLGKFLLDALLSIVPACRLIAEFGKDGIYVNTMTIPGWLVLGKVLRRRVTCHVHEAEGYASLRLRRLLSMPLYWADRVVVNSRFTLQVLHASNPRASRRATIVVNGIAGPRTPTSGRAALAPPIQVLFLGRISPRKGPQVAVAAVKTLEEMDVDVHLYLLGAVYPGYEWFEAELRANVQDTRTQHRIHFLGFDQEVWPHLRAADLVVVPSIIDESFGNAAVEAVLCARPLVVSALPGLMEATAGFTSVQAVEPNQATELALAIKRVVDNWDQFCAQAMSDSALARERHSVRQYQQAVIRVLEESLTSGSRSPSPRPSKSVE